MGMTDKPGLTATADWELEQAIQTLVDDASRDAYGSQRFTETSLRHLREIIDRRIDARIERALAAIAAQARHGLDVVSIKADSWR